MSRHTLTPRAAARLLDRRSDTGNDALGALLAEATAPSPADPVGEDVAVAQFRAASHLDQVPTPGSEPVMIRIARRMVAAPVAALGAAALVLAGGGVTLAASHGVLDVPFTGHDNRSDHAPAAPATTNPGLTRAATAAPATPSARPTETPAATPSPSMTGLCTAYQAGAADVNHANPAFDALAAAAGGEANVEAYCTALIGPPIHPTHPTHPAKPTQAASPTHPARPSQAATPGQRTLPTQAAAPTQRPTH